MSDEYKYQVIINPDALISEMIKEWINGNKNDVIHQLATDHAGLAAMLIVQGSNDRTLTRSDCNEIANRLIDARVEIVRELWATEDNDKPLPIVNR